MDGPAWLNMGSERGRYIGPRSANRGNLSGNGTCRGTVGEIRGTGGEGNEEEEEGEEEEEEEEEEEGRRVEGA